MAIATQVVAVRARARLGKAGGAVKAHRDTLLPCHRIGTGVHVLERRIVRDHRLRRVVQMDDMDVQPQAGPMGCHTPHAGVKRQHGLDELQRRILKPLGRHLRRRTVDLEHQAAEDIQLVVVHGKFLGD